MVYPWFSRHMASRVVGSPSLRQERKSSPSLPRAAIDDSHKPAVSPVRRDAKASRVASRSEQKDSPSSPKEIRNESSTSSNKQARSGRSNASPNRDKSHDITRNLTVPNSSSPLNRRGSSNAEINSHIANTTNMLDGVTPSSLLVEQRDLAPATREVEKAEHRRESSISVPPLNSEIGKLPLQEISAKLNLLTRYSAKQVDSFSPAGLGRAMRNVSLTAQLPTITREHASSSSSTLRGSSPASRSASPYRRDSFNGTKPFGFQEPLGVSIELGMELVRRNRQLEREVKRLTDSGDGVSLSSDQQSRSEYQKEIEELTRDLAVVSRWAREAESLQMEACRTILAAVRKESPEGRDVHQALARLAAFPPPPMRHRSGGSDVTAALAEELSQITSEREAKNSSAGLSKEEMLESDLGQVGPDVTHLTAELVRLRSERNHAVRERRKTLEQIQSLQDRVEKSEGIAKELVVKLASICQLCDGVPIALAQQQAAAIAALSSLSASEGLSPDGQFAGQAFTASPVDSVPSLSHQSIPHCSVDKTSITNDFAHFPMSTLSPADAYRDRSQTPPQARMYRDADPLVTPALGFHGRVREGQNYANSAARDHRDFRASSVPLEFQLGSTRTRTPSPSRSGNWASPSAPSPSPVPTSLQEAIFNVLDTNKDGMITREELSNALRAGIIQEGKFSDTILEASAKAPRPIMVSSASNLLAASDSPMRPMRSMESSRTATPVGSPLASPTARSRALLSNTAPVLPVTVVRSSIATPVASGEYPVVALPAPLPRALERTPPAYYSPGLAFREIATTKSSPVIFAQSGLK